MQGILSIQSHVVYGCAGNSSAVFPLQRLGHVVWPIHTVQFSNHTQYTQGWTGKVMQPGDISDLAQGLVNIEVVSGIKAVISGYIGSDAQADEILDTVERVKSANPNALYICDPVMGDPVKGCVVSPDVTKALCERIMQKADIIVPNQFELARFTGIEIDDLESAIKACQRALTMGPKIVLVKHLHSASEHQFTMLLGSAQGLFLITRPLLDFVRQPVGVGDLITSLFTGYYLNNHDALKSFELCNHAVYHVLKQTAEQGEWELQIIAAQEELVSTIADFTAVLIATAG
ncbi:pyridoxal kinase PdxY [Vibrio ordalii]|uniref:pyridoxal kinase PdxY n=1 Tax=Vibrio ordalii TaxID=28174 RepID=UPI002575FEB9|nr:pyridoxal kinase PdxY [Vibrio ordalii]MCS0350778.1 pyridoxal kinase PdxY [Vibrio ordalii]